VHSSFNSSYSKKSTFGPSPGFSAHSIFSKSSRSVYSQSSLFANILASISANLARLSSQYHWMKWSYLSSCHFTYLSTSLSSRSRSLEFSEIIAVRMIENIFWALLISISFEISLLILIILQNTTINNNNNECISNIITRLKELLI